jgi:hypothetical protein
MESRLKTHINFSALGRIRTLDSSVLIAVRPCTYETDMLLASTVLSLNCNLRSVLDLTRVCFYTWEFSTVCMLRITEVAVYGDYNAERYAEAWFASFLRVCNAFS